LPSNPTTKLGSADIMCPDADTESDRLSQNSLPLKSTADTNLSTNAFRTFTRLCGSLGPVLTCKHCCVDLIKMLAICYMNSQCLTPLPREG
jgi:hypothetical protein